MKYRLINLSFLCLITGVVSAQKQLHQWHHLDPTTDKIIGISTDKAYELLKTLPRPLQPVIVAVIDGGIDTTHEDLKSVLWTNRKEIAGNSKDDDNNGYIDDVYGWNFLGSKDGRNVQYNQEEETRLYARLKPLYEGQTKASLSIDQHDQYDFYQQVKTFYNKQLATLSAAYQRNTELQSQYTAAIATLKKKFGVTRLDSALLHLPPTTDTSLIRLSTLIYQPMTLRGYADADEMLSAFTKSVVRGKARLDYGYNLEYNPQLIVGDHPTILTEHQYGNADASGPYTFHGTHVAGIIAADRMNNSGVKGIAGLVRILSVRVSAETGDHRDKDLANAIHYAVDNGAKIINLSIAKEYSPQKAIVDEAVSYADKKGVLLVHGAGNEYLDLDSAMRYPSPRYLNGQEVQNMITIGASTQAEGKNLVALFSNYGRNTVDVFAPGMVIVSSTPGNRYEVLSGTSMATPVVSGIAAVLKAYFPSLGPSELKRIIMQSAVPYHTQVLKPGTQQLVDFSTLSKTGAIVNLNEAVKLAIADQKSKK